MAETRTLAETVLGLLADVEADAAALDGGSDAIQRILGIVRLPLSRFVPTLLHCLLLIVSLIRLVLSVSNPVLQSGSGAVCSPKMQWWFLDVHRHPTALV
jgi:hypothetical protein